MDSELDGMQSEPLSPRDESNLDDHPAKADLPHARSSTTSNFTTSDDKSVASTSQSEIEELEKKYPAFVRHDLYGTMGRGALPWTQKILLGIALITLFPLRLVLATLVVLLYYLICRACTLFLVPNREDEQEDYAHISRWRRKIIFWFGRVLSRTLLFVFGFYWIRETYRNPDIDSKFNNELDVNERSEEHERPGAIISNHVSHLDILYHMSSSFPSFVAKRSVGKLPLVGLISKCLGCIYVQRESKSSDFKGVSGVVNDRINESLQDKSAPMVMLFPEGTTTNGDYILPFKTGAFLSKAPVLPVILKYPYRRFSPAWDTISGVSRRHVILLLCQFVNNITVMRLPLYYPSQEEKENPKLYAENVRRLMAREGDLKMSDIGLPEKRVYHEAIHGKPTVLLQKAD
ncbi:hypothetical protein E3N88_20851 [Mikania micrantha]|uniref:Phospholipid/glycerol acyltransferase domain-containing protein n=1 Tax=Mikania micrantha TaxID=192012 RepID=A0A5N6NL06_9ASTR|nr:hypothetical protein E3N88_20851 [Mikania micrantha]